MKMQIHTLEKYDLNSKRNHTLAFYIASIIVIVAAYSVVTAAQSLDLCFRP